MKFLEWVGSSRDDLRDFPEMARREAGHSIYVAQKGGRAVGAKPLSGFGGTKVLEVVIDDDSGAFRVVYTVKFAKAVYVLHAFQKKSRRGVKTPKPDIDLIRHRLSTSQQHYKLHYEKPKEPAG